MDISDSERRDPRKMTDEETMEWMQDLITRLSDEKGNARTACNFEAVKLPIRRKILHVLEERPLEIEEMSEKLEIDIMKLRYHLNVLLSGYFIQMKYNRVDLTPGGVAVVRSDKRHDTIKK